MTVMEFQRLKPGSTIFVKAYNHDRDVIEFYLMKINKARRTSETGPWRVNGDFIYAQQQDEDDTSDFKWGIFSGKDINLQGVHIESASQTGGGAFKRHLLVNAFEKAE